jgi:hypothetical protein
VTAFVGLSSILRSTTIKPGNSPTTSSSLLIFSGSGFGLERASVSSRIVCSHQQATVWLSDT